MKPKLDRWIIYGNCLVGYVYDSKWFTPGERIRTDAIVEVDVVSKMARCVDGDYILLDPGEEWEHQVPKDMRDKVFHLPKVNEKLIIVGAG